MYQITVQYQHVEQLIKYEALPVKQLHPISFNKGLNGIIAQLTVLTSQLVIGCENMCNDSYDADIHGIKKLCSYVSFVLTDAAQQSFVRKCIKKKSRESSK